MRLRLDPFIIALVTVSVLASVLPVGHSAAAALDIAAKIAIGLLFFLYGARLSAAETLGGLRNWRLHLAIGSVTFVYFPVIGFLAKVAVPTEAWLFLGLLFLCCLPSTVQSSVAATSLAGGNTAAAVVSASASNLLSVVLTPLLIALLMGGAIEGGLNAGTAARGIVFQLLVPFVLGQLSRPVTAAFISRYRTRISLVDRTGILIVVFIAFSAGRREGVWTSVGPWAIVAALTAVVALLAVTFVLVWRLGAALRFARADRITLLFCGTQKSLATGLPIAGILFEPSVVPLIVLPLMIYHQLQLIVSASIAGRLAGRSSGPHAGSK